MNSFSSIFRRRTGGAGGGPAATPASADAPGPGRTGLLADRPSQDEILAEMISALSDYLPPRSGSLPEPDVSLVRVRERSAGLGGLRGFERRGAFSAVALESSRMDALVRFQIWEGGPGAANTTIQALHASLLAAKDALWAKGFLRFFAEDTSVAEHIASLNAWRMTADYAVLFEFQHEDSDGAESLIARVPIHSDPETRDSLARETTVVSDEMVRWDDETTSTLLVRGPSRVAELSALSFIPGDVPAGEVSLLRTNDDAMGPPQEFTTLTDFLDVVAGANAVHRHAILRVSSLTEFLSAFTATGAPLDLGDWDLDGTLDSYESLVLSLTQPIVLPSPGDRLEISHEHELLDQTVVLYLRAIRR